MDITKTGLLIRSLRLENKMTQKELALLMGVSDKAVSKWERGAGLPDVELLMELSDIFSINISSLLSGSLTTNDNGGNMKNAKYFVCRKCGSVSFSTGCAEVSCCGMKLAPLELKKAGEDEKLTVETVENDWYITSSHPMTKDHYISFIAFATGEKLELIKQYPEWDMGVRIHKRGHGKLIWYCDKCGLKYQLI